MTKENIEAVWQDVLRLYTRSVANVYPAAIDRLREPFDLALKSLESPPLAWKEEPCETCGKTIMFKLTSVP